MKKATPLQIIAISTVFFSMLGAMIVAHTMYNIPFYKMTRDLASQAHIHPLTGVVSNIGILLWWSSATLCLFASAFFLHVKQHELCKFFLFAGLLSTWLSLDDFFQFHDYIVGSHEKGIFVTLAVFTLAFLIRFRKTILHSNVIFLLLALIFLSLSIVVDYFQHYTIFSANDELRIFLEDGTKWLGISFWLSYFAITSFQHMSEKIK